MITRRAIGLALVFGAGCLVMALIRRAETARPSTSGLSHARRPDGDSVAEAGAKDGNMDRVALDGVKGPNNIDEAHMKLAPKEMQEKCLALARMEEGILSDRVREAETRAAETQNPEDYLKLLGTLREKRMRQLIQPQLAMGQGLLVLDGLPRNADPLAVTYEYAWGEIVHGRSASVLIFVGNDGNLTNLTDSIQSVALELLYEAVRVFNNQSLEERRILLDDWKKGRRIPGVSEEVDYQVGARLRESSGCLLWVTR
jgi:hypothetical protein